jgi:competence protein ComEC
MIQRRFSFLKVVYLALEERWANMMSWLWARWPPPQIASCIAGQSWQWDGVVFTVLSPGADDLYSSPFKALGHVRSNPSLVLLPQGALPRVRRTMGMAHSKNNGSCVLHIDNTYHSVLLTGDIEKSAEHALLKVYQPNLSALHAEIIVAPHHGSKTSSSAAFLSAVQPTWVFYATGYRNRFHFPSDEIVRRYQSFKVTSMDTATDGQIIVFAPNQACCFKFSKTRAANRHFWTF